MNKDQTLLTNDTISEVKVSEKSNNESIEFSESDNSIRKASLIYYLLS